MLDAGSGFVQGFLQTGLALSRHRQQQQQQQAEEDRAKEQIKLLQAQVKGQEATRLLNEQKLTLDAQKSLLEFRVKQRELNVQEGLMGVLGGGAPTSVGSLESGSPQSADAVRGTPAGLTTPALRMPDATVTGQAPSASVQDQGQLQLLDTRRQQLEAQLQRVQPFTITEQGKRAYDALNAEYGRVVGQIKVLRDRATPGSSDVEQLTGRPLAYLSPEEIRSADVQLEQRRLERSRQNQAVGLSHIAQRTYDAAMAKPMEQGDRIRIEGMLQSLNVANALATEFTPAERAQYVGAFGLKQKAVGVEQALRELTGASTDPKFNRFVALVALGSAELFGDAGKAVTGAEKEIVFGYLPTGKEWTAQDFEQKLQLSLQRLPQRVDRAIAVAKTPTGKLTRQQLEQGLGTEGVGKAPPTEKRMTEADIADAMRQTGRSRQEVLNAARSRGFLVPQR
jgi:hypothetical protein